MHQSTSFFSDNLPEYVFLAAGKSGGIGANQKYPADLMIDNLLVTCNVMRASHKYAREEAVVSGEFLLLSPRVSSANASRVPDDRPAGADQSSPMLPRSSQALNCARAYRTQYGSDFIGAIPANVFGPGDDFSSDDSHVIAALIRKMHEAKVRRCQSCRTLGHRDSRKESLSLPPTLAKPVCS